MVTVVFREVVLDMAGNEDVAPLHVSTIAELITAPIDAGRMEGLLMPRVPLILLLLGVQQVDYNLVLHLPL